MPNLHELAKASKLTIDNNDTLVGFANQLLEKPN